MTISSMSRSHLILAAMPFAQVSANASCLPCANSHPNSFSSPQASTRTRTIRSSPQPPSPLSAASVADSAELFVVSIEAIEIRTTPYPTYAGSEGLSEATLSRYPNSDSFQRALITVTAVLSDGPSVILPLGDSGLLYALRDRGSDAVAAWSTNRRRTVPHRPDGESPPGLVRPPKQAPLARVRLGS